MNIFFVTAYFSMLISVVAGILSYFGYAALHIYVFLNPCVVLHCAVLAVVQKTFVP